MTAVAWRLEAKTLKPMQGLVTGAPDVRAVVPALCKAFAKDLHATFAFYRLSRIVCPKWGSERCRYVVTFIRGERSRSALLTLEVERRCN